MISIFFFNVLNVFQASSADQVRSLLDILPFRGPKAFDHFVESLREDYDWLADDLEEAVLAKDDPEQDFIDNAEPDERTQEDILKEILNRGGVPSRPSHHIVRDNEIESLKQGLADLGLFYLSILINAFCLEYNT